MITDLIQQGLLFSLPVMAVFLSSQVIKMDDLTLEGSFATGGAVMAYLLLLGVHPWLALLASGGVGVLLGMATTLLHTRVGMNPLISGICVTTAAFSLNLKLVGANLSLQGVTSTFTFPVIIAIVLGCLGGIAWLLKTEVGLLMRACGENRPFLHQLGRNPEHYILLTLALSNFITAMGGGLFVHWVRFFSITGSIGTLIVALSGLLLAQLFSKRFGVALILGSILYQGVFAATLTIGVNPIWNNLIKAAFIVTLLHFSKRRILCSS